LQQASRQNYRTIYFSFLSFFLLVVKTEFNAILAWFCSSLVARPPEEVICASTRDGSWGGENENDAANAKRSQWGGDDEKLRMNKPRQMKERTGESAAAEPVVDSAAEIWKRGSRCIITRERNLLSSILYLRLRKKERGKGEGNLTPETEGSKSKSRPDGSPEARRGEATRWMDWLAAVEGGGGCRRRRDWRGGGGRGRGKLRLL
jgi:hypothetical protein